MKILKSFLIAGALSIFNLNGSVEDNSNNYEFYGKHFIASYINCDQQAIIDEKKLQEVLIEAAKASGAEILQSSSFNFEGGGLTQVILLSESHASIHTYPEYQSCFVDLFTCGHTCDWKNFDAVLNQYLKPKKTSMQLIIRD